MAETPASSLLSGAVEPIVDRGPVFTDPRAHAEAFRTYQADPNRVPGMVPRFQTRGGRLVTETPLVDPPMDPSLVPAPTEGLDASPMAREAAARTASVADATQEARANAAYRAAVLRGTGSGNPASLPQEQQDAMWMNPRELRERYGARRAFEIAISQNTANNQFAQDQGASRSPAQIAGDSAIDIGTGFVSGIAGIPALGLGLVNDDAGAWAARQIDNATQWARSFQSAPLAAQRRIVETQDALDSEENERRRVADIANGATPFMAGLSQIGRGAVNGAGNLLSNPTALTSGLAEGLGSLFSAGPISKMLSVLGRVALGAEAAGGVAGRVAGHLRMPMAIGLQEGGGAYQQTVSEVMGMSFTTLEENSPRFRELVAAGVSREDARIQLANEAGLRAAAMVAPAAAAIGAGTHVLAGRIAGRAVPYLEEAPFRVGSAASAAGQMISEALEEGSQGAAGALAQNQAIQDTADQSRTIAQGVGEQAAQGAILGLGTAGMVQAPGGAARLTGDLVGGTARIAGRGASAIAEAVAQRRNPVATSTPDPEVIPPDTAVPGATVVAPDAPSVPVDGSQVGEPTAIVAPTVTAESDPDLDAAVEQPPLAVAPVASQDLGSTEEAQPAPPAPTEDTAALGAMSEGVESSLQPRVADSVPTTTLQNTPVPSEFPSEVLASQDEKRIGATLKQEEDGHLKLTDDERSSLRAAYTVLKADREAVEARAALGLDRKVDRTLAQVLSNAKSEEGYVSAAEHAAKISEAFRAKDYAKARDLLRVLGNFVEHMSNRVAAINESLTDGKPRTFKAYNNRLDKWFQQTGVFVNTKSAKSMELAQLTGIEARHLAEVFNGLSKAYPTLGMGTIEATQLVPALRGKPSVPEADLAEAKIRKEAREAEQAAARKKAEEEAAARKAAEASVRTPTVQEVHPDLLGFIGGKVREFFSKSFRISNTNKTKFAEDSSPLAHVKETLGSLEGWVSRVGEQHSKRLTPEVSEAYTELLNRLPNLRARMQKNLDLFLKEKLESGANAGKSRQERLLEGLWINGMVEGKALNITNVNADGSVTYNDTLIEAALLASMNWLINLSSGKNQIQQEDADKMLGREVQETELDNMNKGVMQDTLVRSLAQRLVSYWNLSSNPDAPLGLTQGISEAVAVEIIWAMRQQGLLEVTKFETTAIENGELVPRIYDLYTKGIEFSEGIKAFPSAIEEASLVEPTLVHYYEGAKPPIAKTQLNNGDVPTTPEQRLMMQRASAVTYRPNMGMAHFYQALTRNGFRELFGNGDLEGKVLNEQDRASLDGQNRSLMLAYDSFQNQMTEMANIAATSGKQVADVTIRYAFGITRVGRLMMLGAQNPQSTKAIREVFLSTWSKLDMTSAEHQSLFDLALGQALGVKVHQKRRDQVSEDVQKLLVDLDPVVQILRSVGPDLELPPNAIQTIKETFAAANGGKGLPVTPLAMHALTEQAKLLNTNNKKSFETSLYVEADGVTNGVVNAMMLLSSGDFDATWLKTMGKGGLLLHELIDTMNKQHTSNGGDNSDIYTAVRDMMNENVNERWVGRGDLRNQFDALKTFMGVLLPDVTIDSNGKIEFQRGITKNPVTISLYGSSPQGIAGKMVKLLEEQIASKMSLYAQAEVGKNPDGSKWSDEQITMHVWGAEAKGKLKLAQWYETQFIANMDRLSSIYVRTIKGTNRLQIAEVREGVLKPMPSDPKTFKLTTERRKALQANMKHLFVDPMMQSMSAVIGASLMENTQTLRKATQVQSIILQHMFKARVTAKIAKKKAADPEYMASHFLSQNELNEILNDLKKISPDIVGQEQVFFLSGTTRQEFVGTEFVRGMSGRMSVAGSAYGPRDIGVGGVPVLNIAYGDGQMIQKFMTYPGAPEGVLPIYDGINMPLTALETLSERANRAVWDSWKGNPIKDANTSFQIFLKNMPELTAPMLRQLRHSLFGFEARNDDTIDVSAIEVEILAISSKMNAISQSVDDRTAVMNEVSASVDQMASAGASFKTPGSLSLDMEPNEAVAILNNRLREVAAARSSKQGVTEQISNMGRKDKKSGARVISPKSVAKLFQTMTEVPHGQQQVLREIFRGADLSGYKIVYGTAAQLNNYQEVVGDEVTPFTEGNSITHGVTSTGSKTIYLFNPTSETFTHEMVHAATFMKLQAMLEGEIDNEISREVLTNLRTLADQFMSMEEIFLSTSNAAHEAWTQAVARMNAAPNEAIRLNEFMAWTLANKDLAEGARATSSLVQWLKDVLDTIKQVIFGRKRITKPEEDFFSNLLFTSSVIMRSQPTVAQQAQQATLFMSTVFGTDSRLNGVQDLFDSLFLKFANEPKSDAGKKLRLNDIAIANHKARIVAHSAMAAGGFIMNTQERFLFENIVAAFATSMQINPASVAEIEAYYRHVMKHLTVEDFMSDPSSLDPNVRDLAQKQYDVLAGNATVLADVRNRTTLMPTFLGLAIVNQQFRDILAKMPVIQSERDGSGTMDARLDNFGSATLETLSNYLSGTKGTNVQQAIDALVDNIHATTQQKLGFIETFVGPVGRSIDWMNEKVVYGITKLANGVIDYTNGKSATATNPYAKFTFGIANMAAKLTTEKRAEEVSLGVMHALNRQPGWDSFRAFMSDLVGRTNENRGIYDLIKGVKTAVSQLRQQFREKLPQTIRESFSRTLSEQEWTTLYRALGKTDLASLLGSMSRREVLALVRDSKALQAEITKLEKDLAAQDLVHFSMVQRKSKQLAGYMMGENPGQLLLKNAESIARLNMHSKQRDRPAVTRGYVQAVDALVTLYAFQKLSKDEVSMFNELLTNESEGVDFALAYMKGQREEETRKATGKARFNALKGYIASASQEGVSFEVADKAQGARLESMGYEKVGDYVGSRLDPNREPKAYYYAPVSGRALYNQGIYQNVRETSGGVDTGTGFTYHGKTAGVIADPREVAEINKALLRGNAPIELETLIPVIGDLGVAIAYERSIDQKYLALTKPSTNFADMLGVWRGRQAEEAVAHLYNVELNKKLVDMWKNATSSEKANEYVNILDPKQIDPVVRDAVNLMTYATKKDAVGRFQAEGLKDSIMVRRDMLNDTLGYRKASIGDAWTGVSRLRPETQKIIRDVTTAITGKKAYIYATNAERIIQNAVRDVKVLIVVKSVIVPVANIATNILQMVSRGVPLLDVARGVPRKLNEIDSYVKSNLRKIDLEAQIRAADAFTARKLELEVQSINDSHRRLSIWPLIQAGEFSNISDAGVSQEDTLLTEGRWGDYIEQKVNALPQGVRTAGRYAIITRDTSLFQGLQKSVAYGDFVFKAILYDHLTQKKGKLPSQALAQIMEEFVNYDRLPGRTRGYLEDMGLLWFYNYKIRFSKVALSIIRRNPVQALFAAMLPIPLFLGSVVDLPTDGALFMKAYDGKLHYSMGPAQGIGAIGLHPLVNLLN